MSKTKERILDASLAMFNEQGERQVTTNHIARELGMSPGNLYYHFKNKDEIVVRLYRRLIEGVSEGIVLPSDRLMTLKDKHGLLEQVLQSLWAYRFIYRDLRDPDSRSSELAIAARELTRLSLSSFKRVLRACVDAGIMNIQPEDIDGLAMNNYLVLSGWQGLVTSCFDQVCQLSPEELARSAIYQILLMDRPYITDSARAEFEHMQSEYRVII